MRNASYNIITIGCQMNKSDSERIAAFLEDLGYKYNPDRLKAKIVILTTCGIRQTAEDRIYGLVPRIKRLNPRAKIILTGCLSHREDVKKRLEDSVSLFIPVNEIFNLKGWLAGTKSVKKAGNKTAKSACEYLSIHPKINSSIIAFVPIGNGCDNFCSYCVVPYARGREAYRPLADVVNEVKNLIKKGYKEINLVAQNVNSYRDPNNKAINFPKLLKAVNEIKGDFWIRFLTSHPKDMSDELIKTVARCEKACRYIHLPVQSGDDKILGAMNRKYTAGQYKKLLSKIRKILDTKNIPVSISTDLIVGFPGETRRQFNNSARLFRNMKFDMAYISQFSPRPQTAAAKMKDSVTKAEKKNREEEINKILSKTALANNKKYLGKTVRVLVEGKTKAGQYYGKTETYKVVKLNYSGKDSLTGSFINVRITKAHDFGLDGRLK